MVVWQLLYCFVEEIFSACNVVFLQFLAACLSAELSFYSVCLSVCLHCFLVNELISINNHQFEFWTILYNSQMYPIIHWKTILYDSCVSHYSLKRLFLLVRHDDFKRFCNIESIQMFDDNYMIIIMLFYILIDWLIEDTYFLLVSAGTHLPNHLSYTFFAQIYKLITFLELSNTFEI